MKKTGRNAPCPCGSGLKYKKCCLRQKAAGPKDIEDKYKKKHNIKIKGEKDIEGIRKAGHLVIETLDMVENIIKPGLKTKDLLYPREAISDAGTDVDFFTTRKRELNEPLPWDHIDAMVDKQFLKKEFELSAKGEKTPDCRLGECSACGVCDFDKIGPALSSPALFSKDEAEKTENPDRALFSGGAYKKLTLIYSKLGNAKYFGHLELVNIFFRAFKRAEINLRHSRGFHPKPKVSFEDSLPINMESMRERFYIETDVKMRLEEIVSRLNRDLPEGLRILDCFASPIKTGKEARKSDSYLVKLTRGEFDERKIEDFQKADECIISRRNKKGREKKTDIKNVISSLDLISKTELKIIIGPDQAQTFRPPALIKKIFSLDDEELRSAVIIKTGRK